MVRLPEPCLRRKCTTRIRDGDCCITRCVADGDELHVSRSSMRFCSPHTLSAAALSRSQTLGSLWLDAPGYRRCVTGGSRIPEAVDFLDSATVFVLTNQLRCRAQLVCVCAHVMVRVCRIRRAPKRREMRNRLVRVGWWAAKKHVLVGLQPWTSPRLIDHTTGEANLDETRA